MSERLEEIKNKMKLFKATNSVADFESIAAELLLKHGDWLVEQTERVDNMQKLVNYHQQKQKEAEDANEPYRHQNKRYREALEFYATSGQAIGETKHGEVAREALESESE